MTNQQEKYILLTVDKESPVGLIKSTLSKFTQGKEVLIVPEMCVGPNLDFLRKEEYVYTVTNKVPMDMVDFVICVAKAGGKMSASSESRALEEEKILVKVTYP